MNRSSNVCRMHFTTVQPEWVLELHLSRRCSSSSSSDFSEDSSIMPRTRTVNRSAGSHNRRNSDSVSSSSTVDLSDSILEVAAFPMMEASNYRIVVDLPDTSKNQRRNGIADVIEISDSPVRNTPSTSNMANPVIDLCSSPEPESEHEHDDDYLPSPPDFLMRKPQRYPTCPICFTNLLEVSQVVTTKCGHIFCKGCILESLCSKSCCPMCRKKVIKSQLTTVYLNSGI